MKTWNLYVCRGSLMTHGSHMGINIFQYIWERKKSRLEYICWIMQPGVMFLFSYLFLVVLFQIACLNIEIMSYSRGPLTFFIFIIKSSEKSISGSCWSFLNVLAKIIYSSLTVFRAGHKKRIWLISSSDWLQNLQVLFLSFRFVAVLSIFVANW